MSYRDELAAMTARAEGLQREVDELRAALAAAHAHRVDLDECPACGRAAEVVERLARCPGCTNEFAVPGVAVDPTARAITFEPNGDYDRPLRARVGAADWLLVLGDFPAEPLYTLLIDGVVTLTVDDWPPRWRRRA
ncbi:MAG: hypothetical protein KBG28_11835 [Kofleriaceae bacterium]|nr:hypothetical protein [Kofleriaceae bacterium]MBP6836273.1 hypothetical protein [Kofleriaceae bacterium]MBP9204649.1 hypothetical protein [Kofleriaceae bacterium]